MATSLLMVLVVSPAPVSSTPSSPPAPPAAAYGPRLELSLADAVFLGLRENRTIESAYVARAAEKYDLFVAESRFRPRALVSGGIEVSRDGAVSGVVKTLSPTVTWLAPTGATFQFGWSRAVTKAGGLKQTSDVSSLSMVQPLMRGGGLAVNEAPVRIAEAQEAISRLSLKGAVIDTITSIILTYRSLLQAQLQLSLAEHSLDRARTQFATNQALVAAGRLAAAELLQTEADIANQQLALLQAEQQRNSAQLALLHVLAMDPHTNIVAKDTLEAEHLGIDLDRAIAAALNARPDILAQRQALAEARQNLIVARNNQLWNLSLVASAQRQASVNGPPEAALPRNSSVIGVQLAIPIGDYSLDQAVVHARTNLRLQEIQLQDLLQQAETQTRDAVQAVEMAWRQVEAARRARELAAQTLDVAKTRLQVGRASNFEVMTFEANLRTADNQALNASVAYANALTALDQQLGATLDTWKIRLAE